jgi:hypothetical protein
MPQNFRNWMALDKVSDPSSPSGIPGTEFQDWSNLTGPSDLIKAGMTGQGVAPPQNWTKLAQQAVAPIQNKFNNISNAATQLGQGNTFNAYNSLKGRPLTNTQNPAQVSLQQTTPDNSAAGGFDFSR